MADWGYIDIDNAIGAGRSDHTIDFRFWTDISRMWPRRWWSPVSHWRDFRLRHYARRQLHQIRKGGSGRP